MHGLLPLVNSGMGLNRPGFAGDSLVQIAFVMQFPASLGFLSKEIYNQVVTTTVYASVP